MPAASDNKFPKVILEERATDGSDTSNPAADHRALFLGEDGGLHLRDSSGTVTDVSSGAIEWGETGDITDQDYDDVADAGVLNEAARADHLHGMPSASGGSFDPDEHMPWLIDINVYVTGITQTNFNTLSGNDTAALYGYWKQSGGSQNDEIGWDVILAAGTWTLELIHVTSSNRGIYTASLDAGSVGTIDGYDGAGPVRNVRSTITGISVAATGKKRLLLKMATKNASSSSYFGSIQHVSLRRTA